MKQRTQHLTIVGISSFGLGIALFLIVLSWATLRDVNKHMDEQSEEYRDCDDAFRLLNRLLAVESPDARPCINCVLDDSETPYCKALCGPTPTLSLCDLYDDQEAVELCLGLEHFRLLESADHEGRTEEDSPVEDR